MDSVMILKKIYITYFKKYEKIINILKDEMDDECICNISQKSIGERIGLNQTSISKCLRRLGKIDTCIIKVAPGKYKVNHTSLDEFGPFARFMEYLRNAVDDINFLSLSIDERAVVLRLDKDSTISIHAYFIEFIKMYKNS